MLILYKDSEGRIFFVKSIYCRITENLQYTAPASRVRFFFTSLCLLFPFLDWGSAFFSAMIKTQTLTLESIALTKAVVIQDTYSKKSLKFITDF